MALFNWMRSIVSSRYKYSKLERETAQSRYNNRNYDRNKNWRSQSFWRSCLKFLTNQTKIFNWCRNSNNSLISTFKVVLTNSHWTIINLTTFYGKLNLEPKLVGYSSSWMYGINEYHTKLPRSGKRTTGILLNIKYKT